MCKYLSGKNLPRIKLIRGKLCPDRYFTPYDFLLISVAFVVLCRIGCLGVPPVLYMVVGTSEGPDRLHGSWPMLVTSATVLNHMTRLQSLWRNHFFFVLLHERYFFFCTVGTKCYSNRLIPI